MIPKGSKLIFCKECNRNRFCIKVPIPVYNFRYTCSKGHTWTIKGLTFGRLDVIIRDIITPKLIENLFNRDDAFFKNLKK